MYTGKICYPSLPLLLVEHHHALLLALHFIRIRIPISSRIRASSSYIYGGAPVKPSLFRAHVRPPGRSPFTVHDCSCPFMSVNVHAFTSICHCFAFAPVLYMLCPPPSSSPSQSSADTYPRLRRQLFTRTCTFSGYPRKYRLMMMSTLSLALCYSVLVYILSPVSRPEGAYITHLHAQNSEHPILVHVVIYKLAA